MPRVTPIITNFTAGELSPFLDGRVDISRYYNSAKTLENFLTLPAGGIKRRPGTYYVEEVKDSTRKTRLIPFQFSTSQAYIIEFGDRYCRFYANRGQILSSGAAYEITSPYLEAHLFDLQFAQDADTMWIVHPLYKPRKLTRAGPSWDSYVKLMLHCNGVDGLTTFTDEIGKTITTVNDAAMDTAQYKFGGASGLFDTDDSVTAIDSADWNFAAGDFTVDFWMRFGTIATPSQHGLCGQYANANSFWFIDFGRNAGGDYFFQFGWHNGAWQVFKSQGSGSFDINTWHHVALVRNSTSFKLYIDGNLYSSTTASVTLTDVAAILTVGRSNYGATTYYFDGWLDEFRISKGIARWTANFTPPTTAYAADIVTFAIADYTPELMTLDVAPGGAGWSAGDTITGNTSGETCVIVAVLTTTTYNIKDRSGDFTLGEVMTNATDTADQGAAHPTFTLDPFGDDASDDCPSCVSIFEQRIFFANTNNYPQTVWGSVAGDYEDMTIGATASDALSYAIGSEEVNAIRWLSSGRILGLGTLGGVFSLGSGSEGASLTPTNVVVKKETSYGALGIVPRKIGNSVYYVQRNSKIIREFSYSYDIDEYASYNTNLLADHITGDGIVDVAYQQSPYNILWCVRDDGVICTLTRQKDQEVVAWTRQITDGEFESVAVIPGDGGDDEVWFIVRRLINGSYVRYIEYLKPMDYGSEQEDAFFVDSGLSLDSPTAITGITQAEPGVVTAVAHGLSDGDIVIIRGVVGMTEVNKNKYEVANSASDTFELTDASTGDDIDTSDYTTYVSGGEVRKCVTSLSGLDHLEAEVISLLIDGEITTQTPTVATGAVTITDPANGGGEIHAGMPYTSKLKTMRVEAGSAQGTAQGKLKRISQVYAMVVESLGLNIGTEDDQDAVAFPSSSSDVIPPLYSGWLDISFPSLWDKNGYVVITEAEPIPLNVMAIVMYLTTSDT